MNLLNRRNGRLASFFTLYLSEGLPQGFVATALALEFKRMGMLGAALGTFSAIIMLPWAWKWLLGPLLDNFHLQRFGRRKQWIVVSQVGMISALVAALLFFPTAVTQADGSKVIEGMKLFTALLVMHNVFAACQDVAIDAMACDTLEADERGLASGLMFGGAETGAAIGGSGVLFLKGWLGFSLAAYVPVVILLGIMMIVILFMFEKQRKPDPGVTDFGVPNVVPMNNSLANCGSYMIEVLKVFFTTKLGFLGLVLAFLPFGGLALSTTVSTILNPTLGMTDNEIASMTLVGSIIFIGSCVLGGFLSDRFGRRKALFVFSLGTLIPTLWMGFQLHSFGNIYPIAALADGTWPRNEALIQSRWIAAIIYALFSGMMYGVSAAIFMDIVEPRIAATQFTAYMALTNLGVAFAYWWQGQATTTVAAGGWGLSYLSIFSIDAMLGVLFALVLPFLKTDAKAKVPVSSD